MSRKRLTKVPINNAVVIADTHCGCQFGLMDSQGHDLDAGGRVMPSRSQRFVWECWEEFWGRWVPEFCHNEPYVVVINGDLVDGRHHNSTHQWSQNLTDQCKACVQAIKPKLAKAVLLYITRGTDVHDGESGQQVEALARALDATPTEDGQYARYDLWLRVGRGLAHIAHHIGTSGSMHYESSAPTRELSEAYNEAGRWNGEAPDWVVRSHRHRCSEVRLPTHKGLATVCVTAGWQLKTPFAYRIAGARQAQPQIGGTVLRCGDTDLFTRHQVWTLERPKEETPCV